MTRPTIQEHMTPGPHTIGRQQPLTAARKLMREHAIRHLPVLDGGELVGIVSDRDIALIETLRDVDPEFVKVSEAMTSEVFAVKPDASLEEVAATMAERKYGAAVVVDRGKVVGVFTTVDGLRTLASVLGAERPG